MIFAKLSRQRPPPLSLSSTRHLLSTSTSAASSRLRSLYAFEPPASLHPQGPGPDAKPPSKKKTKPPYRPPSSLDRTKIKAVKSDLPFDFRFSYTESSPDVRPIGLREPKYSPFGPGRFDREWTGVCAPAVVRKARSVEEGVEDPKLEEKRKAMRESIQGEPLTGAERKILVERSQRHRTKRQINLGMLFVFPICVCGCIVCWCAN